MSDNQGYDKCEAMKISEQDSKDCPHCGGKGLTTVFAPSYKGDAIATLASGERYVARLAATCQCPLGIFIRKNWPEDVRRWTPSVIDILENRSRWLLVDPTET